MARVRLQPLQQAQGEPRATHLDELPGPQVEGDGTRQGCQISTVAGWLRKRIGGAVPEREVLDREVSEQVPGARRSLPVAQLLRNRHHLRQVAGIHRVDVACQQHGASGPRTFRFAHARERFAQLGHRQIAPQRGVVERESRGRLERDPPPVALGRREHSARVPIRGLEVEQLREGGEQRHEYRVPNARRTLALRPWRMLQLCERGLGGANGLGGAGIGDQQDRTGGEDRPARSLRLHGELVIRQAEQVLGVGQLARVAATADFDKQAGRDECRILGGSSHHEPARVDHELHRARIGVRQHRLDVRVSGIRIARECRPIPARQRTGCGA
ncbi:hypothetical protein GCM10025869_10210 [Homoserinibacter gongjuensis]|uniref:Uncharacterized protein n=1 Tax=Homoserinibacter gongjuensis TaxID=1162968 RepID=A0ABQ6JQA9_9MICO|nr:hypothetical protein GCM10025869_10210 [Homoserinibacter gongjuensis]